MHERVPDHTEESCFLCLFCNRDIMILFRAGVAGFSAIKSPLSFLCLPESASCIDRSSRFNLAGDQIGKVKGTIQEGQDGYQGY